MSLSAVPRAVRDRVMARDGGRCQYCGLAQFGQAAVFHINHVLPRSRGGATAEDNLVVQCTHCSLHKSDKVDGLDPITGDMIPLFRPLRQRWDDHFTIDPSGLCHGATATGRVTVAALAMNAPRPRVARALQIQLGIIVPTADL